MYVALCLVLFVSFVSGGLVCLGWPKKKDDKYCASTTRYNVSQYDACGCGKAFNDNPFGWNQDHFIAAANQMYFDSGHKGWCGQNCCKCVKLTTTGGYVDGRGGPTLEGVSHVFMVTNLCPAVDPYLDWCAEPSLPEQDGTNKFGYAYHFDLENGANQVSDLGWNNPEVTVEVVPCSGLSTT